MKILFTGGGSGGHVFPIVAIVRELKKQSEKTGKGQPLRIYFVGPKSKVGIQALKKEGIMVKTILAGKIRRYFGVKSFLQNIIDIVYKLPVGFIQALLYIKTINPDIVFSKGGYGALPVIWAVRWLKIPIFLHESDIAAGKATKISAKSATKIFISFEKTKIGNVPPERIYYVGNPIRKELLMGDEREAARIFNLTNKKPIILILGGSQGAERVNNLILGALPQFLKNFELIHQCGEKSVKEIWATAQIIVKEESLIKYYHPVGFLDEEKLKHAYRACHLIVSRAGSGAIFEIAAVGKPSVLIPLPEAAQGHQAKNANAYAASGAAIVMESKNPTPALLYSHIMSVFSHPEKLKTMSQAALAFAKPNAAELIAEEIISPLEERRE